MHVQQAYENNKTNPFSTSFMVVLVYWYHNHKWLYRNVSTTRSALAKVFLIVGIQCWHITNTINLFKQCKQASNFVVVFSIIIMRISNAIVNSNCCCCALWTLFSNLILTPLLFLCFLCYYFAHCSVVCLLTVSATFDCALKSCCSLRFCCLFPFITKFAQSMLMIHYWGFHWWHSMLQCQQYQTRFNILAVGLHTCS